ncbi:MAG: TdeIII family type II restriction endonuclease [Prevotellaceae bacterium]|jgi:hypothetical protein|nr:TdeIII family type II restriction endonuclease [Prevotellaceae bacterium]
MALNNKTKEKVALEVIKVLVTRFESFPENTSKNRNAPFHEAFLKAFADRIEDTVSDTAFLISLSSWLQGLNTTLGQTFFENVAHILCNGEKREYTSKKRGNLSITQTQRDNITKIIADLSTSTTKPHLQAEEQAIFLPNESEEEIKALDFSADVFFEDSDSITAIELKSVKPNSGEMRGEKQKILEGKAALFKQYPNKKVRFYIGFPFDPTVNPEEEDNTAYNKTRFLSSIINMNKFFAEEETLIAEELWDFLSGEKNTMKTLLDIINIIATPDFYTKYQVLTDDTKRNTQEHLNILNEWYLVSESHITRLYNELRNVDPTMSQPYERIYNQSSFDSNGKYNWKRFNLLEPILR